METTSGVLDGLLALPGGGGGARGIGERFQPDPLRGSGSYAIPLPQPKGPNQLAPSLSLRYSTGQGNGPFGVGWQLAGPLQIQRRTDNGVPAYDEGDEFTLSGADLLVPVGGERYRPASDRQGWRIERAGEGWRVTTKEGRRLDLGTGVAARVADGERVFAWLLERETDVAGNVISYGWEHDEGVAYLAEVAWSIFALRLRYEERPDPLRDGRAGFPRRTTRRCVAIERFADRLAQPLIMRHRLAYTQAEGSGASLLAEVRLSGHAADGSSEAAPPIGLEYSQLRPQDARLRRIGGTAAALPALDGPATTLVDMDGDGLPDVVETGNYGHRWWRNAGEGRFDPPRQLPGEPQGMTLGRPGVTFADLDGDGAADLLRTGRRLTTFVPNTGDGAWGQPVTVRSQPVVDVSGARTRMVDLDGDGVTDLLQLGRDGSIATYNRGEEGWSAPEARTALGELAPPPVDLAAPEVHLADMSGDGLTDVVAVESGRVRYWPCYGRASWGPPVEMEDPPLLPRRYDPSRLHLVDVDGDGVADLLYVDSESLLLWINRAGAGWSEPYAIDYLPPPDPRSLQFVDLLGTGIRGMLWRAARGRRDGAYDYLELAGTTKPNLLTGIDHGDGGSSEISYATSTAMRIADEAAGRPWDTFLPFPVHVVEEIAERDALTERTRATRMRYHGGVWSGTDREFRGFGRVEVVRIGDEATPDVMHESTFSVDAERPLAGSPTGVRVFELGSGAERTLLRSATIEWATRVEHDGPAGTVHFPHATVAEVRDHATGEPDRIEVAHYDYDEFGNLQRKRRSARFSNQPEAAALRTDERLSYAHNEAGWRVGLPCSIELRDAEGRLLKATRHHYDGPDYEGLPLGEVGDGLVRRTRELVLADWALPAGYADGIELGWGLQHEGEGWWRDVSSCAHDAHGNLTGERDGFGAKRRIAYDADGLFSVRHTDTEGAVTTAAFDERAAAPTAVELADGRRTEYEYSPLGWVRAKRDTTGDGTLQLTEVQRVDHGDPNASPPRPPRLSTWRPLRPGVVPDELPDPEADHLPNFANVWCDYYDSFGNPLERVARAPAAADGSARWRVSQQRDHNVDGRAAADRPDVFADGPGYLPPSGHPVRFSYDAFGAVRGVTQPDGGRLRVRRSPGRLERWDASIPDDAPPVVERYDALGHLIAVEEPCGGGVNVTAYEVDLLGRVTSVRDASGRVAATYLFAGPGPCLRLEHADAGQRTYHRDAEGRIRVRSDGGGRRLEMDYDTHGRLVRATDASDPANPAVIRELSFDGARLISARENGQLTRFEYDAAGVQTAKVIEFGQGEELALHREFGLQGELRAIVHPDGTRVEYDYDASEALIGAPGWVEGVEYDANGSPLRLDLPGGAAAVYEYDPVTRRIARAALENPTQTLREARFEYDLAGRIVGHEDRLSTGASRRDFGYDALSRIVTASTSAGADPARVDRYAYSATGDLLRNDESPAAAAMEYGDASHAGRLTRLRAADGATADLDYDDAGRITTLGDALTLEYDVWDRLVRAELEDGTVVRLAYDAVGTRTRKVVEPPNGAPPRETRYLEDVYMEGAEGASVSIRFDKLMVGQRSVDPAGDPRSLSFLTDHLGSILAACDHGGQLVDEQIYAPFGRPLAGSGGEARFAGARGDPELGLVQLGARWYAPSLGRFITPDWFVIENPSRGLRLPQSLNAYGYALNNPLVLRDPSGLWFGLDDAIAAGAGFVVGFAVGVIVGIAEGRSVGDTLLLGLEAGLLGAVGAWLAWNTAGLALAGLSHVGLGAGGASFGIMVGAAVVGGLNGVIAGATEIYDWSSWEGWPAFVLDSSWGLVGTTLGLLVMGANLLYGSGANYRSDLSKRQNRHVYDGGFGFGTSAFTEGNVTSNMRTSSRGPYDLDKHENLHVWQSRGFGPIYPVTYVAWLAVGAIVGVLVSPFTDQSIGKDIKDIAYYDNPWELWAYAVGGTGSGRGELA